MIQPIVAYNSAKLTELEHKIDDITVDTKLPLRLKDSNGSISAILFHKTWVYNGGIPDACVYIKLPELPYFAPSCAPLMPSVDFNIKVSKNNDYNVFSLFNIVVLYTDVGVYKCNIDNTHNSLRINTSYSAYSAIRYYVDEESNKHYYVKLYLYGMGTGQVVITLLDMYTDSIIPEDFSTDDMIVLELPAQEVGTDNVTKVTNPFMDAVKSSNTVNGRMYIMTSSASDPQATYPNLFPDTAPNWTITPLGNDVYAWKYTGT
jgi:hypothetical protein